MGSRRFFFFLPEPGSRLSFKDIVSVLSQGGLEVDSTAFIGMLDTDGTLLSARERRLQAPTDQSLVELIEEGAYVETMFHDRSLAITCAFGSPHESQLVSINASRKMWLALPDACKDRYERMFVKAARESGAMNVLVVDDPPDDFLGRIEPIDRQWMIDPQLPGGYEMKASTVLVNSEKGSAPLMRGLHPTGRIVDNFREFEERIE